MADPRITRRFGNANDQNVFYDLRIELSNDASTSASSDSSDSPWHSAAPTLHAAARAMPSGSPPDRRNLQWQPELVTPPTLVRRDTLLDALTRQDREGVPPLVAALLDGDYELALALLAHGAAPGRQAEYMRHGPRHGTVDPGTTAMTLLALHPFPTDFLRAFLSEVAKHAPYQLDRPDGIGATVLGIAAGNGDSELMALLLEAGANPNHADGRGDTPLCIAARRGDEACAALLLGAGARADAPNDDGDTPLAIAARQENIALLLQMRMHGGATTQNTHYRDALEAVYRRSDIAALQRLSSLSPLCQSEVAEFVIDKLCSGLGLMRHDDSDGEETDIASDEQNREEHSGDSSSEPAERDEAFLAALGKMNGLLNDRQRGELALALMRSDSMAADYTLALIRETLPPTLMKALRREAAKYGRSAIHAWAAERDPTMPKPGADAALLHQEWQLAVAAGNEACAASLRAAAGVPPLSACQPDASAGSGSRHADSTDPADSAD
jgi:ankyrin repeat protein